MMGANNLTQDNIEEEEDSEDDESVNGI